MRLDGVEPARGGGRVDGLDVVGGHERLQAGVLVGVEVVHHHVEPRGEWVAGPQAGKDGQQVGNGLALAHLADEAVGMDIVEREQLLSAVEPAVGGAEALRVADRCPGASPKRPQLERATLVEADDGAIWRIALVEVEDAVFFTSKSGSGDCFQVFVC